jgi:hypothetical protein
MKLLEYYCPRLEHLLSTFRHDDLEDLERSRVRISGTRGGDTITRPSPRSFHDCSASGPRIRRIIREMVKIEDRVRIQKLVHESMNRHKNRSESDESEARVHESYSQIFDSFDSRFIRKIRKIRVQITPLGRMEKLPFQNTKTMLARQTNETNRKRSYRSGRAFCRGGRR